MDIEKCRDYQPIKDMEELKERLEHYKKSLGAPHTYTAIPLDISHPIILFHIIDFLVNKIEALEKQTTEH